LQSDRAPIPARRKERRLTAASTPPPPSLEGRASPTKRLFYRWFVEYNPLYLLSAGLVLVGLTLLSRASAEDGLGQQGVGWVPGIAEVYGFSLIGGAALLMRIGLRRPAVMLGLLAVIYQGDLTLLTERHVHLGLVGDLAAVVWLALFVAKIRALAWALKVTVSRSFLAVATAGAAGLAIIPHGLYRGDATSEALVVSWVFGLCAAALWTERAVTSRVPLDHWQRTVLARSSRATWALWGLLLSLHVGLWASDDSLVLGALVPGAILLGTRWMKEELPVWTTVSVALALTAALLPESFWLVALMASAVLALRALSAETPRMHTAFAVLRGDAYRRPSDAAARPPKAPIHWVADSAAKVRLLGGTMFGLWLAAWTRRWTGGPFPAHVFALDLSLTAGVLLLVWKARARAILAPLAFTYLHFAARTGLISAPSSPLEWGVSAIATGFALLILSLFVGWRLRDAPAPNLDHGQPSPPR
jgi:hypothetical protein